MTSRPKAPWDPQGEHTHACPHTAAGGVGGVVTRGDVNNVRKAGRAGGRGLTPVPGRAASASHEGGSLGTRPPDRKAGCERASLRTSGLFPCPPDRKSDPFLPWARVRQGERAGLWALCPSPSRPGGRSCRASPGLGRSPRGHFAGHCLWDVAGRLDSQITVLRRR